MQISANKYYLVVTGLFFAISFALSGTEQLLFVPLCYIFAGPGAFFIRFYENIFDLSLSLKYNHNLVFKQHVLRWVIGWSGKVVTPYCIFSKTVNGVNDMEIKKTVANAKLNLLFLLISFVTLPLGVSIIMLWR